MTYPAATANLVVLWGRWWDHLTKAGVDATITATPLLATGQAGSGSPNLVSLVDQAEIKTAAWSTKPLPGSGLWALPLLPTNDAQFGAFGGYRIQAGSEPPFIVEILESTPTMTMTADMIAALNAARVQSNAAPIGISVNDVAQAVWVRQAAVLPSPAVAPPAGVLTSDQVVNLVAGVRQLPPGGTPGQVPTPKAGGGYEWIAQSGGAAEPSDTFTVADQAAMLALTAQRGDIAIRQDRITAQLPAVYILGAEGASTLANWINLPVPADAVTSVAGKTGIVTLAKGDVGLGNVDNTADNAKPVSTAQQSALDAKSAKSANLSDLASASTARANLGLGSLATVTPTGTASATTYLDGTGAYSTPAGGGGSAGDPMPEATVSPRTTAVSSSSLLGKTNRADTTGGTFSQPAPLSVADGRFRWGWTAPVGTTSLPPTLTSDTTGSPADVFVLADGTTATSITPRLPGQMLTFHAQITGTGQANRWLVVEDHRPQAALDARHGAPIPALEAVPFTVYGDSYGQGIQGADQASRPFDRLATRHRTQSRVLQAVGGTRMDQIAAQVAATWTPNSRGLVGLADGVINDERQYLDNSGTTTTAEAFRTIMAYLTAAAVNAIGSSAFAFGLNWSAGASSTAGATADVAFTGDTAYLLVSFVTGTGGSFTVKNTAGTTLATVSTGGYKQAFTGSVKLAGLGSGTRSLRIAVTSGAVTLVGLAVSGSTPPVILWDKCGRLNGSQAETDRIVAYQAGCAAIAPDFPSLLSVDMGSGWDYSTMISGEDNIHRNDLGNRYAADVIESALRNYLGPGQRQGLDRLSATTASPVYTTPTASYVGPSATVPSAPTSFSAVAANQITAAWTRAADGGATVTSHIVQASLAGAGNWSTVATVAGNATGAVITGLASATSYDFRVAAINGVGTSSYSATATATTPTTATTHAADTFTRADAATTPGTTETGSFTWAVLSNGSGTAGIASNRLSVAPTGTAACDCVINDGQVNGTITATLVSGTTRAGLVFRIAAADQTTGYVFWANAGSGYVLSKRTSPAAYTQIGASASAAAAGDVLSVVLNGSSIVCRVNGTSVITLTDSTYTSGTRNGLWALNNAAASTFDNYSHTDALV